MGEPRWDHSFFSIRGFSFRDDFRLKGCIWLLSSSYASCISFEGFVLVVSFCAEGCASLPGAHQQALKAFLLEGSQSR